MKCISKHRPCSPSWFTRMKGKKTSKTIISLLNCCSSVLNHHISTKPSIGFFRFRPANLNKTLRLNLVSAGWSRDVLGVHPPQNLGSERSPQADFPKKNVVNNLRTVVWLVFFFAARCQVLTKMNGVLAVGKL